jgi:hypothetical protein
MKIVGLTGPAGGGKDTVCGYALEWCEEHRIHAARFAFADTLKRSAAAALGFHTGGNTGRPVREAIDLCNKIKQPGVRVQVYQSQFDPDEPPTVEDIANISGREFLQFYGTEAHRDVFGKEFWVEAIERKLSAAAAGEVDVVFLTDTRFPNEAKLVRKYDGEVWEVVRPAVDGAVEAHASEAGLPDGAIEFQIHNDGELADLRTLVRSVCEHNIEEAA